MGVKHFLRSLVESHLLWDYDGLPRLGKGTVHGLLFGRIFCHWHSSELLTHCKNRKHA